MFKNLGVVGVAVFLLPNDNAYYVKNNCKPHSGYFLFCVLELMKYLSTPVPKMTDKDISQFIFPNNIF